VLVIFDCDGVLVDSEPLSNRALSQALCAAGLPMTERETTEAFLGRSWMSVEEILRQRFGAVPDGLQADYRRRMQAAFEAELAPVAGIEAALDALAEAGVPTCVASSGPHAKMRLTLGLTGLRERFEGRIFSAWDVERGKPAPDLFLHAAARMGAEPEACVVVEDSPVGVAAARAAAMTALGYCGRTPPERLSGADATFADMAALPALLAEAGAGAGATATRSRPSSFAR
jgi:HAD superfamily hydrolase (TIGR01509 family)